MTNNHTVPPQLLVMLQQLIQQSSAYVGKKVAGKLLLRQPNQRAFVVCDHLASLRSE